MDAKLIIVGGKANKSEIALRLPTIIGRSRDADLTMAHPMVSRQHCELYEEGGLLKIRDLGSLNGTYVGDEQVREADLYPNAEFTVGPLTFRVKYQYSGPIAAAPAPVEPPDPLAADESEPDVGGAELGATEPQTAPAAADFVEMREKPVEPANGSGAPVPVAPSETPEVPPLPSSVAPADGEMPDFAAWDAIQQGSPETPTTDEGAPQGAESLADAETDLPRPEEEESTPDIPPAAAPPSDSESDDEAGEPDEFDEFLQGLE